MLDRDALIEAIIDSPKSGLSLDVHIDIGGAINRDQLTPDESKKILAGVDQKELLREFLKTKKDNVLMDMAQNCNIDSSQYRPERMEKDDGE